MLEETLYNQECPCRTPNRTWGRNTLVGVYEIVYTLRNKKRIIGAIGVKTAGNMILTVDLWFREGKTDTEFVKKMMLNHPGWQCMVTCRNDDLPTRLFIKSLGFEKQREGEVMRLYTKEL